jgi:biotin carboxylase
VTSAASGRIIVVLGMGSPSPARIIGAAMPCGVVFTAVRNTVGKATASLAASLASFVEIDPAEPRNAGSALRAYRPVGITTFSESALGVTADLAVALGLPYHSADTVTALTRKDRQRARLAEVGVDHTRSVVVTDRTALSAAITAGPVVVKPVQGQGSLHTYLIQTLEDVPANLPVGVSRPFLVEEFLSGRDERPFGDYVSVETVSINGHAHVIGVTGKLAQLPPFREPGQFVPSRLDPADEQLVAGLATRAVEALGMTRGLAHTEIKLTPNGPRIIEVNGRLGGHIDELYARAFGVDMLAIELGVATGTTPAVRRKPTGHVYYQYSNLGPAQGGSFVRVSGVDAVRALPGVTGYRAFVSSGTLIARGVSTTELDLLTGHADDHDAMLTGIDKALKELTFTIADDTAARVWRASRAGLQCPS